MRIHLTGRITIEDEEHALDERNLPGRQGRVVFARLAWAGGPVHRDVLADLLWPQGPPATWERTLISVMSRLRSALTRVGGLSISTTSGSYALECVGEPQVDVRIAAAECEAAERALGVGDAASAAASASVASAIARRPFLAGDDSPWTQARRAELRALLVRALETGAEATLGTSEAVAAAGEAVDLDPYRERANLLLIRAHHALGNSAEALRVYERYRSLLAEELGTDPGPDAQALYLELLRSDDDRRLDALAEQGLIALPKTHTTFVGRAEALEAVGELLRTERLVTLTGAGGVGKTRLAIEVARRSVDAFPDGIWLVDLAPFSGSAPIVEHVAHTLGVRSATVDALASLIAAKRVLVILDNCEQVIPSAATLTEGLLASTDGLVVLATSRSPLNISCEHVWRVPSLHMPGNDEAPQDAEAVALFCNRAAAVRPDFELTSANAPAIVSICARLDGIALAIELAAARTSSMSASEIAERLHDRFALLRGPAAALPRHRTLRTTIDWSYDLLGVREADVFRSLAVFEGSFTAEAAAAVCGGDVDEEIASLGHRSLLVADPPYRMLETLREFARERAAGTEGWDAAVERHLEFFVDLLPKLHAELDQEAFLPALGRLRADANSAVDRALARGRIPDAIRLTHVMGRYWLASGLWAEARMMLGRTIEAARSSGHTDDIGPALSTLGKIALNDADFGYAEQLWTEALAIATKRGDDQARADALAELSASAYSLNRDEDGANLGRQALELAEEIGSHFLAGRVSLILAGDRNLNESIGSSRRWAERALAAFENAGSQTGIARALISVGMTADPRIAPRSDWEEPLQRAVATSRKIEDRLSEGMALFQLGVALAEAGRVAGALDTFKECLRLCRRVDNRWTALNCVEHIGLFEAEHGQADRAVTLLSAVPALRGAVTLGHSYFEGDRKERLRQQAIAQAGVDAEPLRAAGAEMSFDDACALAMSSEPRTIDAPA